MRQALPCTSSLLDRFPQTSTQKRLFPTPGVPHKHDGRPPLATPLSSSLITPPFSTPRYGKYQNSRPTKCSFLMWCIVPSGDWASGVWNAAGIPGQEQSCAQRTNVPTCEAFVRANGGAMAEACTWFYFSFFMAKFSYCTFQTGKSRVSRSTSQPNDT